MRIFGAKCFIAELQISIKFIFKNKIVSLQLFLSIFSVKEKILIPKIPVIIFTCWVFDEIIILFCCCYRLDLFIREFI